MSAVVGEQADGASKKISEDAPIQITEEKPMPKTFGYEEVKEFKEQNYDALFM